jgi:hypothetical protein
MLLDASHYCIIWGGPCVLATPTFVCKTAPSLLRDWGKVV